MSLFIFAGGFLNLAGLLRRPELIAMVVIGDIAACIELLLKRNRIAGYYELFRRQTRGTRILAALCFTLLVVFSIGSLTYSKFSTFDDLPAYLTFPVEIFQLGALSFDPFSERRVQSGLGANYFLQAFMLVAGGVRSFWFVDAGAGLALFAGCIYRVGRRLGNAVLPSLALALAAILVPLSHVNLGLTILPAAIFCSMFLVETVETVSVGRKSILLGLLAGAAAPLRSQYFAGAAVILCLLYLLRMRSEGPARAIRNAAVSILAFAAVVLPWMLDMKRKDGTLLYPVFGRGYAIRAYGPVPHLVSPGHYPVAIGLAVMAIFTFAAIVHWIAAKKYKHAAQISIFLLAAGILSLIVSVLVAGYSLLRYTMTFDLAFVLIFLASLMRISFKERPTPYRLPVSWAVAVLLMLGMEAYAVTHDNFGAYAEAFGYRPAVRGEGAFLLTAKDIEADRRQAASLQRSIPAGQPVYAAFMPTFAMDFRRNQIFVADFPGMSSLPPGMPTESTPGALRKYFLSKSIRFIAYNSNLAELANSVLTWQQPRGWTIPWIESMTAADVENRIVALSRSYSVIYDDGNERVIDLLRPRT